MKKSPLAVLGIIMILIVVMTSLVIGCSKEEAPATSSEQATTTTTTTSNEPEEEVETTETSAPVTEVEQPDPIKLTLSLQWTETSSNWQDQFKPVVEEMEQLSNGRLEIVPYLGTLGKNQEQYDIARTGKADMVHVSTGYTPGRFPLYEIMTLPLAYETTYAHQEMVDAVGERIIYQDFTDTHICEYNQSPMFYLYTTKPVTTLEEFQGMKIRTSGAMVTKTVEALGGVAVSMGLGDLYLSLQTGVVDGCIVGPGGMLSFNLQEVAQHELKINLGCTSQIWVANQKTWDSLPEDIQQIITKTSKKIGAYQVDMREPDCTEMSNTLLELGGTSNELTPEEYARWVEKLTPIVNDYLDDLRDKGLPADELMEVIREECTKRDLEFPY